ncbi:MAG: 2-succinyl-5-enolpyruvyl-6-hydroxy-3-cyclohexene-1-carboxylic-acid synthase [Candidatus Binatia bacterium]
MDGAAAARSMQRSSAATYSAVRAFVDGLARAGLREVCIAPGARSTPLALVLAHDARLRCWSHIDERSAAFFALGLAKTSRAPAAVLSTSGTAAAHFFPALIEARYAHVPLIALTADRPPELRECGAFQAIDQLKLYGDQAKWFCEVGDPAAGAPYFRSLGTRAVATAAAAPAGPVHLNFPFREPLGPESAVDLRPRADGPAAAISHAPTRLPNPAGLDALAEQLGAAPRGVIVCGPLDADAATCASIAELAARCGWPILADATAQLRDGAHDRSQVVAGYDLLLRDGGLADRLSPDLVLRIGPLPISKALMLWLRDRPSRRHVVVDPAGGWDDPLHCATEIVPADIAPLCRALAQRVPPRPRSAWLETWLRADHAARAALTRGLASIAEPFEGSVVATLAAELPDGATLMVGNSMATRDLDTFWAGGARRRRVLCNRGVNGIDGFASTALGAAAATDGPTIALTGDLGFIHDLNGLMAVKRHGIRAVFVVCNNDGGAIFSYLPIADESAVYEQFIRTPHGLDLRGGVEMYGCGFARAASPAAFRDALAAALASPRAEVIEVPIDLAHSVAKHRELWAAGARAARSGAEGA